MTNVKTFCNQNIKLFIIKNLFINIRVLSKLMPNTFRLINFRIISRLGKIFGRINLLKKCY